MPLRVTDLLDTDLLQIKRLFNRGFGNREITGADLKTAVQPEDEDSGAISVTDGSTTVAATTSLTLSGATVTDEGDGEALIEIDESGVSAAVMTAMTTLPAQTNSDLGQATIWVVAANGTEYKVTLDGLLARGRMVSSGEIILAGKAGTEPGDNGADVDVASGAGNGVASGGNSSFDGGASGTGATGNGGWGRVAGGDALSTDGNGGDAIMLAGVGSGTGRRGRIKIDYDALPTVEPEEKGVVWRSGADLKISAG